MKNEAYWITAVSLTNLLCVNFLLWLVQIRYLQESSSSGGKNWLAESRRASMFQILRIQNHVFRMSFPLWEVYIIVVDIQESLINISIAGHQVDVLTRESRRNCRHDPTCLCFLLCWSVAVTRAENQSSTRNWSTLSDQFRSRKILLEESLFHGKLLSIRLRSALLPINQLNDQSINQ